MSGSLTNFAEVELLDHVFNAAYTPASTLYLALCTADPTDAALGNSMNEVPDAFAYQRTAIAFDAATARAIQQTGIVTFPAASGGSWGTATHYAVVTSQTYDAGDVLATGDLSTGKLINDGNTPSVAASEVDVTFSAAGVSDYLAHKFLDFMFRDQTFTMPDTYVGFVTATIDDDDTGSTITEVTGGSYARKQVNINGGSSPTWDLAVSGDPSYVDNGDLITLVTATADWTTCVAWFIADAATLGQILFFDNGVADQQVDIDDTAEFPVGGLDCQIS